MMIQNCYLQCKYALGTLVLLGFTVASTNARASSAEAVLDALSKPQSATIQVVSYNAVHNGVQQAVATFQSPDSIDTVFDFYRTRWAQGSHHQVPGYLESALPQWRLISRLQDGYNIVVQLNEQHTQQGSTGFVSVRALDVAGVPTDHGPFANLDLLSSNHSVDGVDTSLLRVYASALSVTGTYQLYKQRLLDIGWAVLSDTPGPNNHAMVLTREQARLELTFLASQQYASVIVVHRVTSE